MASLLLLAAAALGVVPPERAVGVNLDLHAPSSGHLLFVDAMKRARPWTAFVPGGNVFDSGAEVPLDEFGMPLEVPFVPAEGGPPQIVRTVMFEGLDGNYPAGRYLLEFAGQGRIAVSGDVAPQTFETSGAYPLDVRPGTQGLRLVLERSAAEDPVRELRLWLPGFRNAPSPLHPEMIARLRGFSVLRAREMMAVQGGRYPCDNPRTPPSDPSCQQSWAQRTRPDHLTQAVPSGVALEHLVELANASGADFWPGLSHAVTDDWVRGVATLIRDRLDPERRVYVELSSEIWNFDGRHPQHEYFRALGMRDRLFAEDLPEDDTDAGRRAYVRRAVEIWGLFEDVFGADAKARLVRVMPGFFANPWHSNRMMTHLRDRTLNPERRRADALAVGAYFGGAVADTFVAAGQGKGVGPDTVLDAVAASLGGSEDRAKAGTFAGLLTGHARLAQRYRVRLVAYEGGPHLRVGSRGPSPINRALHTANRHPRMGEVYDRALDLWFRGGGAVFVARSFVGTYGDHGAFGHLEYMLQPMQTSPKFLVLRRRLRAFGADVPATDERPLGPRWYYARTGVFPGGGLLLRIPLEADAEASMKE